MPQPRRTTTQKARAQQTTTAGGSVTAKIDQTLQSDPEAIERIQKSILTQRMAPSGKQSASHVDWERMADELGQPFDAEIIPFSKLRQMRRDPMIGFGLHYLKTPLVNAPWRIKCADPKIAAFVDAALRPIYARLIFQYALSLDFGFSAISKQFQLANPNTTYIDEGGNEQPVWSEGEILPVIWKPFTALPPEDVSPVWDPKTDELNGIKFQLEEPGGGSAGGAGGSAGGDEEPDIDIYHTLWATNEKDSVFGSLYGYPRIGYAYQFWWTFWYRWHMANRAFERTAVPPLLGRYPEGRFEDEDGNVYDNMDMMLAALGDIRSMSDIALPSDPVDTGGQGTGTLREWEIEYVEGGKSNWDLDGTFEKLQVMMLRALFVPEQTFLEGQGGTSSRNVARQMAEVFVESQATLMSEIDDHINRYLIPHLVLINFPEFIGECRKITTGFSSEDTEFMKQIIQLVGQQSQNPALDLGVDMRSAMERVGIPLLTPTQLAQKNAELQQQSAITAPAETRGVPGQEAAVVPDDQALTGFSYAHPGDEILLSSDAGFLSRLPNSDHFKSKKIKAASAQMQAVWARFLHDYYIQFAKHAEVELSEINLADEGVSGEVTAVAGTAAAMTAAKRIAEQIVKSFEYPSKKIKTLAKANYTLFRKILGTSSDIEGKRAGIKDRPNTDDYDEWTNERLGWLLATVEDSSRSELVDVLVDAIANEGSPKDIAYAIRDHFDGFPQWKADRIARTEAQTAYNVGTIMTARSAGVEQLQAHDASDGEDVQTDEECKERHGKIFKVPAALRENEDEHPNGTLYFTIIPKEDEVAVEEVNAADIPEEMQDALAFFDHDHGKVVLSEDLPQKDKSQYMIDVVEAMQERARAQGF